MTLVGIRWLAKNLAHCCICSKIYKNSSIFSLWKKTTSTQSTCRQLLGMKCFFWLRLSLWCPLSSQNYSNSSKAIELEDHFSCIQIQRLYSYTILIQNLICYSSFCLISFRLEICIYKFLSHLLFSRCVQGISLAVRAKPWLH